MKIVVPESDKEINIPLRDLLQKLANPDNHNHERILAEKFRLVFLVDFWEICKSVCNRQFSKRKDCEQITEEIYSGTVIQVFEEIKTFKLPKKATSDIDIKKIIFTWLSKIANFKILEQRSVLKKEKRNLESYKVFLKLKLDKGSHGFRETTKSYDTHKMNKIWDELSDFAKDIVLLCYTHECFPYFDNVTREFTKNSKHLPKEIKNELIERYQTTDYKYRKVKQRAFELIFSCVNNPELVK